MAKVKHKFEIIVISDTDEYPNMSALDIGQSIQEQIKQLLEKYDSKVLHRGYDYPSDVDLD